MRFAAVACAFGLAACAEVAGLGDFVDAEGGSATTTSPTGSAGTGGQAAAGGRAGSGGVAGSGGAQAGAGGEAGSGLAPYCPPGTDKPNGDCCNDFTECTSTFCVGHLCCDAICANPCDSCNVAGSVGTCTVDTCVTVQLGENYDDDQGGVTTDTFLRGPSGTAEAAYNYGAHSRLVIDVSPPIHSLLRFDLSPLPDGVTIVQATLSMYVAEPSGETFHIYEVLEPWEEGTATGETGFANWNHRVQFGTTTNWTNPGCQGPTSSSTVSLASFIPSVVDTFLSGDLPVALVQKWLDTPASNHGVVIRPANTAADNGADLNSRHGWDGRRPRLVIQYKP